MPLYKKVLVMFFSTLLGFFVGYANAESTLTRFFQITKKNPEGIDKKL
jgi:hypothetical protein